jgi:glutathione S-transferase
VIGWLAPAALATAVAWFLVELGRRRTGRVAPGLHEEISLPHEAEWELWHNDFSLCSKKIRVCLAELGIEYTSHHVDLVETGRYGNLDPAFLKVNPAATVPVLVHRGHPVYESHEQLRYAARFAAPERSLVPEDAGLRDEMERWVELGALVGDDPMAALERSAGNCVPGLTLPLFAAMNAFIPWRRFLVGLLFHRLRMRPVGMMLMKARGPVGLLDVPPLAAAMRRSFEALGAHLDALEASLAERGGPFLLGAQFTLADAGMMVVLDRLAEGGWIDALLADRPLVAAYWGALQARDSFRVAIDGHRHPTVARGMEVIARGRDREPRFAAALRGDFTG